MDLRRLQKSGLAVIGGIRKFQRGFSGALFHFLREFRGVLGVLSDFQSVLRGLGKSQEMLSVPESFKDIRLISGTLQKRYIGKVTGAFRVV